MVVDKEDDASGEGKAEEEEVEDGGGLSPVKDGDWLPPVTEEEEKEKEEVEDAPQRQRSQGMRRTVEYKELDDIIEEEDENDSNFA